MIVPKGVEINGKNTWEQFRLILSSYNISPPEVKQNFISVPGRSGDLDFSEALTGYPMYGNRKITLVLGGKMSPMNWFTLRTSVLNAWHNRKVQVIFEEDPGFYWEGRATVQDDFNRGYCVATFSVVIHAQPYKLEIRDGGSASPWLWDPFSFVDGVIREYHQIRVNGEYQLNIIGLYKPVIPIFKVSDADNLKVEFYGNMYTLQNGTNKFYEIVTQPGDNILKFSGSGTVTVEYRGGTL